jgi:hypothetical protein
MKLQAVFLAEHVAAYDRKLHVLGGLPGEVFVDELPVDVNGLVMVQLLDLTDETFTLEGVNYQLRPTLIGPDRTELPVAAADNPVGLKPGYPAFIYRPVRMHVERPGRHRLTVSHADDPSNAASTAFEVVDMRPTGG